MEDSPLSATSQTAPSDAITHPVPSAQFYSVEYPGYVLPQSVQLAVRNLGGEQALERAFKRGASKEDSLVDLRLRPDNPFAHPIPGEVVQRSGVLLKVVRRKRKRTSPGAAGEQFIGEYKTEVVGPIHKTIRFRSMADFHYQPNTEDPVSKLRTAMQNMDVDAIRNYKVPPEKQDYMVPLNVRAATSLANEDFTMNLDPQLLDPEPAMHPAATVEFSMSEQPSESTNNPETVLEVNRTFRSNIRLFPPPIFSRQALSQTYNFRANPTSMVSTTADEETGEEKKRLINRMRWKGYGPSTIAFTENTVPTQPPQHLEDARNQVDERHVLTLQQLFAQRPIWSRLSLLNQFPPSDAREIINSKILLPLVCYVFQDGPWRDTLIKFGYDPRHDPEARFYQRIYFRNANHPINRVSVISRKQDRSISLDAAPSDPEQRLTHQFDGLTVTKETAAFQLCDIVDPLLKKMIETTDGLRETCDERDGWYTTHEFERIKIVLRHKFFSCLDGYPATDEDCYKLLQDSEGAGPSIRKNIVGAATKKLRPGKYNRAKGALRPEDAAAFRLRAMLDRNVKSQKIT